MKKNKKPNVYSFYDKYYVYYGDYKKEIGRLNNIINEIEEEVDRLLERQYKTERFARENGFSTYLPAKINLECVKDKIKELKGVDKE